MAAVTTFSRTASNNNSAAPDGWPEGQSAASVNNCARELMKGIVDEATNNACKVLASVAGTNTITGTLTPDLAAYSPGMLIVATPAVTNTGATTLNIDSLGAIAVQGIDGSACVGGELVAGIPSILVLNSAATAFIIVSPSNRDSSKIQSRSANYTTVASDNGKYQSLGGSPVTIGVGASTAGSVIPFLAQAAVTINVSTGTLYWFNGSGALVTGARTLVIGAVGTILVNATDGYIFGAGIS